jgi:hypothetical protein
MYAINPERPAGPRATTLGSQLEQMRLRRQARRISLVISALSARTADVEARGGRTPRPLALALGDFQRELSSVEERLRQVDGR